MAITKYVPGKRLKGPFPEDERQIKLVVAYDGTGFFGYQKQAHHETIQEHLENALSKICNEPIVVYGISRTDAGVHAKGQIVSFFTTGSIPAENVARATIAFLPPTIMVRSAEEVPREWRARHTMVGKEYVYRLHVSPVEDPITMRYHWHIKKSLNFDVMREGAAHLLGTHDFTTFKGANGNPAEPIRTIHSIDIRVEGESVTIHFIGDGFLYNMVRNLTGLLVDIGLGKRKASDVPKYIEARDRKVIGKTAPAKGLCLERVIFEEER